MGIDPLSIAIGGLAAGVLNKRTAPNFNVQSLPTAFGVGDTKPVEEVKTEITKPSKPPATPTVLGSGPTAPAPAPTQFARPISPGSGFTSAKSSVIGGAQSSGVRTSPQGLPNVISSQQRKRSVLGTL